MLSGATHELVADDVLDLGRHRLKDFAEPVSLFQLGSDRFPPLRTISNTNLPVALSSFVGREQEVTRGRRSRSGRGGAPGDARRPGWDGEDAAGARGGGGAGERVRSRGVLDRAGTVRDPALVVDDDRADAGCKAGAGGHIGDKQLLLVLDNLEQLVESAVELAALLQACPNLRLLVTSRELLRVDGEVVYPVPALAEPEAVELFCARARIESDEAVVELCGRLDNLPLALELAAARVSVLTPAQILERISQRLDLFRAGRDADPRQQTLRATIAWSYDLLDAGRAAALRATGRLPRRLHARGGRGGRGRQPRRPAVARRQEPAPAHATSASGCWRRSASTPTSCWREAAKRRHAPPARRRTTSGSAELGLCGAVRARPDLGPQARGRARQPSRRARPPARPRPPRATSSSPARSAGSGRRGRTYAEALVAARGRAGANGGGRPAHGPGADSTSPLSSRTPDGRGRQLSRLEQAIELWRTVGDESEWLRSPQRARPGPCTWRRAVAGASSCSSRTSSSRAVSVSDTRDRLAHRCLPAAPGDRAVRACAAAGAKSVVMARITSSPTAPCTGGTTRSREHYSRSLSAGSAERRRGGTDH